ncbi:hypothetical protein K1719_028067 [Acacia pycnantha]|nr:hypothetical protein K1719_028067 [Acacia pycnantha]
MASSDAIGNSNVQVAPASSSGTQLHKNSHGNRSDIGWKHGFPIEGDVRKVKCKYCEKVVTGGIYRLKHHLAGTQKDVRACRAMPEEVKKEMLNIVAGLQVKLMKNTRTLTQLEEEETGCEIEKRKRDEGGGGSNIFKKSKITT